MRVLLGAVAAASVSCADGVGIGDGPDNGVPIDSATEAICSNPVPPQLADISRGSANGVQKYRFVGSDTNQMNVIRAKLDEWETLTGVIDLVEDPSATYVISVDPSCGGCVSTCLPAGCPVGHETGHGLGLAHEQQRADAGRYLSLVFQDDICNDWSEGTRYIDTIWSGTNYGPYNEDSVEHYGPVIGGDSTFDFTRRDGTTAGLGGDMETITPGDVSSYQEYRARHLGWDRFRSRGTVVGDGPLVPQLVTGVNFQAGQQLAAAKVRGVDVAFVFGTNGRVYMGSRGTKTSSWKEIWTSASHIAATTQGGELIRARATSTGITTQRSTNADTLAATVPAGDNGFNNAVTWSATTLNWGLPSTSSVTGIAVASTGASQLTVVARTSNGTLWIRRTTSLTSVTGSWSQITTGTASGRPAMAAFGGNLRVFYATVSGPTTNLVERTCTSSSCGSSTTVRSVQTGSSAAVSSSATTLHLVVRNPQGRLEWHRHDTAAPWSPIGGRLNAQPAATNSFEDRFASFALFAELS
ncbi:MAG TPA: M12 family metallopeptidase, partial [Polyangiaceae bacterium]